MLKLENCRGRQNRLLRHMESSRLDIVVLGNPKTIYYFTGALIDPSLPQAFVITSSGKSLLVTNAQPSQSASSRVETYTGYTIQRVFGKATMNEELVSSIRDFVGASPGSAGVEFEFVNAGIVQTLGSGPLTNITPALDEMRRRKDPDEIECMRVTTGIVEASYAAIKSRLEPGMTEYQAHLVIYDAMVEKAGTSVLLNGDFACGCRGINGGGPPTERKVQQGDLYIFDLFPIFEGYMCDLCRTFAASTPTQLQLDAWAHVLEGQKIAQKLIRPGASCRALYEEVRRHLDNFAPTKGSFNHHLGHGLGMDGWEYPWLTPGSDQVIQEGEIIACEPGVYSEQLGGGIRLEHNYLVGKDSATPLDQFPMDLR